jgi:hypothetical protein
MDAGVKFRFDGFAVVEVFGDNLRHVFRREAAIPHLIGNEASIGGHVALSETVRGFDHHIIGKIGSLEGGEDGFAIVADAVDVLTNEESAG